jgi:hypothetical protein
MGTYSSAQVLFTVKDRLGDSAEKGICTVKKVVRKK